MLLRGCWDLVVNAIAPIISIVAIIAIVSIASVIIVSPTKAHRNIVPWPDSVMLRMVGSRQRHAAM
jgi:hypothetical protein